MAVVSGCGSVSGAVSSQGNQLTVYSSLPLQGPSGAISQQIVDGEKLALHDSGGHIGPFKISYDSMDDSSPTSGQWDPSVTASNAKTAANDPSTIAYLGDYNSAATAISLPLINAADILQVSPASPYGGLTSSAYAGQDEPERFYPTGRRNFARLQPGDPTQARAQVRLMRELGVRRVYVLDDQDPFELPLAQMVVADAEHAGISLAAHDSLDTTATTSFTGEVAKVARIRRPGRVLRRWNHARKSSRCGSSCTAPILGCGCSGRARWSTPPSPRPSAPQRPRKRC